MGQSEILFLPAAHGDAFIIHCFKGDNEGFIVVDGGPYVNPRLNPFIKAVESLPRIDLMILTHQDDDHLIGIKTYIQKHRYDKPFPVEKLWVNSPGLIEIADSGNLSAGKAKVMADILGKIEESSSIKWKDCVSYGFDTSNIPFADIKILSPTKKLLFTFLGEYMRKVGISVPTNLNLSAQRGKEDFKTDLDVLAWRKKMKPNIGDYNMLANMVSIAFVLESDGLKILMLGDSFPQLVEDCLKAEGYSKDNKLKVDYVKVSHHGSRNNISNSLLDMIDCQNFLISTNGGTMNSYHPDRETFANILCHSGRNREETIHFFFNYELDRITSKVGPLFREKEQENYNFEIHQPDDEKSKSVTLRYYQS